MTDSNKMYSSKLQVAVVLFLVSIATADISTPTYEWTDETGNTVICQKCPPGTYVATHCSSNKDTVCLECPDEHYTQYWHYLDKCRFCNVICQEGEQVKRECNATHNRVCDCQPAYHRSGHYCVKDPQCNFQALQEENEDCDTLIIDYILSPNIPAATLRRLEVSLSNHKVKKPVSQRRIRNLLKEFRNGEPDHPLLPRLLNFLKEAKISTLEKKLRKKFLQHEEA